MLIPGAVRSSGVISSLLNGKMKNAATTIVYGTYVVLLYNSPDILQAWLQDVPQDIFYNPKKYLVSVTMRQTSGTPYNQVDRLTYEIRESAHQFVVNALGSGFVSGHQLGVSVTISKLNDV